MLDNAHNLDLTAQDIALIEAALHTQKKILTVQSQAGGRGARKKLTDLKHLMRRLNRLTTPQEPKPAGILQSAWSFFTSDATCSQSR
ncbi:hypothetical protein [Roseobacter sp.]|uniref:hypothetical protein n=1 Tax=Roseobacter sp. TaxID=1907202 RepID=UPI0025D3D486|nr:hypothetical protein [Roseobacter sp.]